MQPALFWHESVLLSPFCHHVLHGVGLLSQDAFFDSAFPIGVRSSFQEDVEADQTPLAASTQSRSGGPYSRYVFSRDEEWER